MIKEALRPRVISQLVLAPMIVGWRVRLWVQDLLGACEICHTKKSINYHKLR